MVLWSFTNLCTIEFKPPPQVRFMKSQFETKLADKGIPVDVIDMKDYGMMNGEAVLGTALSLMK